MAANQQKLIFASSVEALLKAAHGNVKPETTRRLGELNMTYGKPIDPAYPADVWATAVRVIGADLFPKESPEDQHRKLGALTVKQFAETFMGKAMFTAAKVMGVQRSMQRMTNNLRTGANFIETKFTTIDDRNHELWISDVSDVPGFYAGLIEAGADYMSGWADEMRIKQREGEGCLYTLRRTR
ncbi:MAG: DUF2378 family protein [Myxococcaceae bacterium]|nr:DUF2378 family protein [Myxococcaceae bacterium]